MDEYFFMYSMAFVAVLFTVVQDVRTREIANWVTFSLIAFVLAYRAFYSVYLGDLMFFVYGLIGILLFVVLGYFFYYSKVFAGGDAKLLFGIGGIFPYSSFFDYIYYGLGFVFVLFTFGVIYTLIYSFFLVGKNYKPFKKSFFKNFYKIRFYFVPSIIFAVIFLIFFSFTNSFGNLFFFIFVALLPLLFSYVRAVEKSCMIKLISPEKLTEGDWLERDVVVGKNIIRKSFQGLSFEEVLLLRKNKKNVWIKSGIPFAPAFLLAILFFLFYSVF